MRVSLQILTLEGEGGGLMYVIGKYTDRRNRQAVDCSKTIWIMATNALDDTILDFCDLHQGQVHQTEDSHRHAELMTELSGKLKKQLKSTFGVCSPFPLPLSFLSCNI
jgi:hypothetical protein